jgi:septal ring factor EnvC (AmiA/AmiB activator)
MSQGNYSSKVGSNAQESSSLQETIDDLRAEIATLKSQLKAYRVQK